MTLPRAHAFYFGSQRRSLFGWLHAPPESHSRSDIGVVLCNPFGYEAICVHRTYRHFAEHAADAGFATLRFDYDGTGDSSGDDYEAKRVYAWTSSIHQAVDELKARTGVTRVCLVGTRLGATLAAVAAAERDDVAGLIAIAPVVKGRAFLRELCALALARPQPSPPEWARVNSEIQEAAGFVLTAATQKSLQEIDLTAMPRAPAPQALLLERDDLPQNDTWRAHLVSHGVQVARKAFSGYSTMTLSAHENVVPNAMLRDALAWLNELAPREGRVSAALAFEAPSEPQTCSPREDVRESAVRVDAGPRLFGILAEPVAAHGHRCAPRAVVLVLNAGAISRIGPGRLYVTLARTLAQQGHAVLRLDISGIGDSSPHPGEPENSVYTSRAQADIDATLKYLQHRFGNVPVHVVGICAGAFHAFKAAVAGAPLRTAVVINPLTFFWKEGMSLAEPEFHVASAAARYRTRALKLSAWLKLLRGKVNVLNFVRVLLNRSRFVAHHSARDVARRLGIPVRDDLAQELRQAVHGATRLFFIFGSGDPGLQLLREQGGSAVERLQRQNRIRLDVVTAADHTFTAHWARDHLIGLLAAHLDAGSCEAAAA